MLKPKFGITGTQLKVLAMVLMVLDHQDQMFIYRVEFDLTWMNMLGRPVLPILIFLCSEGFHYTHSRTKYLFKLGIASVFMSIINMAIMLIFNMDDVVPINNAFCTKFTAAVAMCDIEKLKKQVHPRCHHSFAARGNHVPAYYYYADPRSVAGTHCNYDSVL